MKISARRFRFDIGVFFLEKKMHVLGLQHVLGLSPASIFDFQPIWRAIADFVYARPYRA